MKKAKAEVIDNKDLLALVEIIEPPVAMLDANIKASVVAIARQFLDSLDKREQRAALFTKAWGDDPNLIRLLDSSTGIAKIETQNDAEVAGRLIAGIAATIKEIGESWEKETAFFNRFHKTLTERRGKYQKILNGYITKLKDGTRLWLLKEQQKAAQKQAEAQAEIDQEFRDAGLEAETPAITAQEPTINGLSARRVWEFRIPDKLALVKAVARGKVPLAAVEINDRWLKEIVTLQHDQATEGPDGKRYLFGGVVEVYQDLQMARK